MHKSMKSLASLLFLVTACGSPDPVNHAVDFVHMVDPNATCLRIDHDPFIQDTAICKLGMALWNIQVGPTKPPSIIKILDLTAPAGAK